MVLAGIFLACMLSVDHSINYNCPALKNMALGRLGGVTLQGVYFKPYFTEGKSIQGLSSSIFNQSAGVSVSQHLSLHQRVTESLWSPSKTRKQAVLAGQE